MGGGVVRGLIEGGAVCASDIVVSTPHPEKVSDMQRKGVSVTTDNVRALDGADIVVLAVKPWILPGVVRQIAPALDIERQEVCAIVAGVKSEELASWFGERLPARLSISMPNTAMAVRESMTFLVAVNGEFPLAEKIFAALGRVSVIPENRLAGAMALASCGTAFAMRYVRAACEGGVELGFRAAEAKDFVAQTLKGVVKLLEVPGSHPETEIDKVTTPGGITIKGLNAMERAGFTAAVIDGLLAAARL